MQQVVDGDAGFSGQYGLAWNDVDAAGTLDGEPDVFRTVDGVAVIVQSEVDVEGQFFPFFLYGQVGDGRGRSGVFHPADGDAFGIAQKFVNFVFTNATNSTQVIGIGMDDFEAPGSRENDTGVAEKAFFARSLRKQRGPKAGTAPEENVTWPDSVHEVIRLSRGADIWSLWRGKVLSAVKKAAERGRENER